MKQIVLATHNRHKMEELRGIFDGIGIELLTLDAFPRVGPIEEDAMTLEGNALKKAREVHRQTGLPSLADDTGLEVGYLNGIPGVFSSRYAGPDATYAENVEKLLDALRGVPPRRRGARFRSVLAFIPSGVDHVCTEGIVTGVITESPRGSQGFGYDPIFLPDGHRQTYAEMDLAMKNTLSHRARAAVAMREHLRRYAS